MGKETDGKDRESGILIAGVSGRPIPPKGELGERFDEQYYENGVAAGISGYQDYHWMPERTLVFAHKIIKTLNLREGDRVLDYGCAKGFMVHAFRLLDLDAYGCDISSYAISHAHPSVGDYLRLMSGNQIPFEDNFFREVVAKDVLEHIPEDSLAKILQESARVGERLFAIIPLGDGRKYVIPSYENDVTHIHRQPREWWDDLFENTGWKVDGFSHLVPGMKQNYANYSKGNGFFFLKRV